jgi:hypothetical protein
MANSEQNYLDFKNFIKLQADNVRKNIEEVTNESLGQSFYLHIDRKPPAYFIPRMPQSAASKENYTVPRVTVADTLAGCIQGYGRVEKDFFAESTNGYIINKIDFEYAIKPNSKLVFDAEETGEAWLVTYNLDTRKYKPEPIGKVFVSNINYHYASSDQKALSSITYYIEIEQDIMIRISDSITVGKGYYLIEEDPNSGPSKEIIKTYKSISKAEYERSKKLSASMLTDTCINVPIYDKW